MKHLLPALVCVVASAMVFVTHPVTADITPIDYYSSPTGGGVSPKSLHQTIRLDDQEVMIRLEPSSYTVDAVFHLFNDGETTTEWVGFPKNAMGRQPGPQGGIADFIRFQVSVNGEDVVFTDERELGKKKKTSPVQASVHPRAHAAWMAGQTTFPGHAQSTIRVRYEASYDNCGMGCTQAMYIYGTGGYWKDSIGKATFVIDSTEQGGVSRADAGFSMADSRKYLIHRKQLSDNVVRYEVKDFDPIPDGSVSITLISRRPEQEGGDIKALCLAAMNGRLELVQALLKKGVDVNAKGTFGETPLMAAAWNGSLPVVKLLLEKGADVNAETGNGNTALKKALANGWMDRGQLEVAKFLREHGAKPTTLAVAAYVGDIEAVQRFAAEGIKDNSKNTLNDPAPFTAAAMGGNPEIVQFFLDKGADIEAKNEQGYTPLMVAAAGGHVDAVKLLLDRGADVNARDVHRRSALNHAVFLRGHVEVVKVLLDRGADINARDDPADRTILMHAAQDGLLECVKVLLERGAAVNACSRHGETALSLARGKDIEEIEKVLKAYGAKE